jgi:hypothetical protein
MSLPPSNHVFTHIVIIPIREIFFGCCASAMAATASSTTTKRIDKTLAILIASTARYVARGALAVIAESQEVVEDEIWLRLN